MHNRILVFFVGACALVGIAPTALAQYDFGEVTALAEGALVGQNVAEPVPGFDLLLMRDGQVVYHQSFGDWSLDRIAHCDSATKTISGALVMSVIDAAPQPITLDTHLYEFIPEFGGEKQPITLDTHLYEFIPEFGGEKQPITIRQCFSHTSGLAPSSAISDPSITLQQAAIQIAAGTLTYPPGSTFSYGGTSMHAAGAVVELAGAAAWNALFADRLASPLQLSATTYVLTSPANPRIAGGCESTASEFARIMEMLRRGGLHGSTRVLSEAAVTAMLTRQTPPGIPIANSPLQSPYTDGADYGVGIWLDERDPQGSLRGALAAGARGFSAWIDFDDRMVGVFATDTTRSGNIQALLYLIRDAAALAVRRACVADINLDGVVSLDDFAALAGCMAGPVPAEPTCEPMISERADLDADGDVDLADFTVFQVRFSEGCP